MVGCAEITFLYSLIDSEVILVAFFKACAKVLMWFGFDHAYWFRNVLIYADSFLHCSQRFQEVLKILAGHIFYSVMIKFGNQYKISTPGKIHNTYSKFYRIGISADPNRSIPTLLPNASFNACPGQLQCLLTT